MPAGKALKPALALLAVLGPGCPAPNNPAPASIEVSPTEGIAGTDFPVTIRGTNTHFSASTFAARFQGLGAKVEDIRVSGPTAARFKVVLDDDAAAGPRTLLIDAPPDSFAATLDVRVPGEDPSVTITPRLGGPGADLELTLRGRATHFEDGVTTVLFPEGMGVTVLSVRATTATLATARIHVSPEAPAAVAPVAVVTRDELVIDDFEVVTEARPTVSIDPPEGYAGRTVDVSVTGARADFGRDGDEVTMAFGPGAGVDVTDLTVVSPTRLTARLIVAAQARAGFRRFTVQVDPADAGQGPREFAGTFSVRAPGSPSVRVLPPFVHRGGTATLWIEGRNTTFDAATTVRTDQGSGVEPVGRWVLGPGAAAVKVRVDDEAPLGTSSLTIDDALQASFEVLGEDPSVLAATPASVETGAKAVELTIESRVPSFAALLTRAELPPRSGVAVREVEVLDPQTALVTLDVLETAPTGPTQLALRTGTDVATASLTVTPAQGRGAITLEPPVLRPGLGAIELMVTAQGTTFGSGLVVEPSDPALVVDDVAIDDDSASAEVTLDVPRSTTPGSAVFVLADGSERLAAHLEVLPATDPRVEAAPSLLTAGRAGQLVVAFGEDTSWIPDVTVAAAPVGRGLSVDGLTVIDRSTAILEITVSSEAPPGPTGIVLATHGEISVAPIDVAAPAAPPSISLDPPSVEPGLPSVVTIVGSSVDFTGAPVRVDFPGSPEIQVVQSLVLDATRIEAHLVVDGEAQPGTRPCEVEGPGLSVRAGLAVRPPGTPAVWSEPSVVRRGPTVTLEARVDGLDLETGPVAVSADEAEVVLGPPVLGEIADRVFVDVSVPSTAAFDSFWLTIAAGAEEARHRILVGPALAAATTEGSSVAAGSSGSELQVVGQDTTFAPEETLVVPGKGGAALRFGPVVVASPGQLRVPIDVSAAATADESEVIVVTGSEVVTTTVGLRGASRVELDSPGQAAMSITSDHGALASYTGAAGVLQVLSAEADAGDQPLVLGALSADGFAPLTAPATDPAALVLGLPAGAILTVQAPVPPPEGGEPLAVTLTASPLVADAASELEPNDDIRAAELFPDPVECRDAESCPEMAPTFMMCSFAPGGDRDVFVVPASTPVAFEVFARRLVEGSAGADVGMRAPWTAPLTAPSLGADLVAVLDPGGLGESSSVSLEGLGGSIGQYLVVVRSAVVVSELGWTAPAGYVELRAAPGIGLDGFTVEVVDAAGQVSTPAVELEDAEADATGLVLVSSLQVSDVVVPDLVMPDDGAVIVRWQGTIVDAVAFGASIHWEGTPIDLGGALAVGRRLGIDRNDNDADFTAIDPSPGGD